MVAEIAVKTVCDATSLPKASAKTSQAALQAARIYKQAQSADGVAPHQQALRVF